MVTRPTAKNIRGSLATECVIAMSILAVIMLPVAFSIFHEMKLARAYYNRGIAMQLVDGEMELLAGGEWRAYQPGSQRYVVRGGAVTNLPPGEFRLTLTNDTARLEWLPQNRRVGGAVVREIKLKTK